MRSLVLSTARPVAVALAALVAVPPAFARSVRCESQDYRYRYCPVPTYGDVQLRNERSRSACYYGRSWGYDHRGIWVDRGCRADFAVDEGRRGPYSGYGGYDSYDRDRNDGSKAGAAVVGVALGAAIAAAIVAGKNKNRQDDRDTGTITLSRSASVVQVGYPYNSDGQSLRPEAGASQGTAQGTGLCREAGFSNRLGGSCPHDDGWIQQSFLQNGCGFRQSQLRQG